MYLYNNTIHINLTHIDKFSKKYMEIHEEQSNDNVNGNGGDINSNTTTNKILYEKKSNVLRLGIANIVFSIEDKK